MSWKRCLRAPGGLVVTSSKFRLKAEFTHSWGKPGRFPGGSPGGGGAPPEGGPPPEGGGTPRRGEEGRKEEKKRKEKSQGEGAKNIEKYLFSKWPSP